MKKLLITLFTFLLLSPFAAPTRAQWYAPETNFHDPVQRVFPVELARILAWRENAAAAATGGTLIAEIRYTVASTDAYGSAHWEIQWLDAKGQILRGVKLDYTAQLLLDGPAFYLSITGKMLATRSWTPTKGSNPDDLDSAFWSGLGDMKASRMGTLQAILKDKELSSAAELQTAAGAARLSGRLLSATVPGTLAGLLTIDSTLAARGAAWLALAELGLPARKTAASDNCWAVVLWLARREFQARALWNASAATNALPLPDNQSPDTPSAESAKTARAREWWSFMLTPHTMRETYLRAAQYDDPAWGLPLLARGARLEGNEANRFDECARILYQERFASAHDYAPWLGNDGGVGASNVATMLANPARADWFATINMLSDDEIKSINGLSEALSALRAKKEGNISNLISALYKGGAGSLVPVATVTASDLANCGWELHGELACIQYRSLAQMLGIKDAAEKFKKYTIEKTPELGPFLQIGVLPDKSLPGIDDYNRFQRIENMGWETWRRSFPSPSTGTKALTGPEVRSRDFCSQKWLMCVADLLPFRYLFMLSYQKMMYNLERMMAEGGPMISREALYWLNTSNIKADNFYKIQKKLAASLPRDAWRGTALDLEAAAKLPPLERAQAYERAFWENPKDDLASRIFDLYISARAFDAAKRFYNHAAPLMTDTVGFSNQMAATRLGLALIDGDYAAAEKVLKQSDTYSYQDLTNQTVYAAARNDTATMKKTITACMERYPSKNPNNQMKKLLDFLPLWTAITTPNHRNREKALDYFSDCDDWPTLQWILIKQTKMSTPDAIRFLGGDNAKKERLLLIDYLRGDKAAFDADYKEFLSKHGLAKMARVVIYPLRAELHGMPPVADTPDLCPPNPQNIPMALETARDAYLKTNINERLAALTTEETLWNYIDSLRKNSNPRAQDARALTLESEAAYTLYKQRYPQGKHIWETRLWLLSSERDKTISDASATATATAAPVDKFDEQILEIVNAPDAPLETRFLASMLALTTFMAGREKLTPEARAIVLDKFAEWKQTFAAHDSVSFFDMIEANLWGADNPAAARAALVRATASKDVQFAALAAERLRLMDFMEAPFSMTFTAIDGRAVDSGALRGKVVLVDFWATWCPPCVAEMPEIQRLYNNYNKDGLVVIGISLDADKSAVEKFIANNKIPWPVYFDENKGQNRFAIEWGVEAIPTKCLIDKDGRKHPLAPDADLEAEIKKLLGL